MSRPKLWLFAIVLLQLTAPHAPAFAEEGENTRRLFGCGIGPEERDMISLAAVQHDDGTWHDLQFTIAEPGKQPVSVPSMPVPGEGNFFFSNSDGPEGYFARVRFSFSGTSYELNMLDIPPIPDQDDMGGRDAALTITNADGSQRDLICGETDEYMGYMALAMSCDMTNRYGAAGCDFAVRPTRSADDQLPPGFGR